MLYTHCLFEMYICYISDEGLPSICYNSTKQMQLKSRKSVFINTEMLFIWCNSNCINFSKTKGPLLLKLLETPEIVYIFCRIFLEYLLI